jgi:DNA-binding LacI/PurR family transcriptional regulator
VTQPRPTAILAVDRLIAFEAFARARGARMSIPDAMAVVVFGDGLHDGFSTRC